MYRLFKKIMTDGITLGVTSEEIPATTLVHITELSYYIVFKGGSSSGAVQIESSPISEYAGTWAPEGSPVAWAADNKVHKVSIEGASAVGRARISTAIGGGGSVDVYAVGNG